MNERMRKDGPENPATLRDADYEEPTLHGLAGGPGAAVRTGHPKGLPLLFFTEMWERFSFYGMRALLVFYMTATLVEGGLNWSKETAGTIRGWYGGLAYLTPIIGGYLADRFLGTHRCLIIGGIIIALGHFTLMIETVPAFFTGLLLVIIGTGFFKSNVSTMVGQLYKPGDPRRDTGFTIFYMGINIGAFLAPLVCGWLRVKYGWNYGFGAAGVGMVLGLIVYVWGRKKYLTGIGEAPAGSAASAEQRAARNQPLTREEKHRMIAIFIVAFFVVFFWTAFEQADTSMGFFARDNTDRSIPESLGWLTWLVPPTKAPAAETVAATQTAVATPATAAAPVRELPPEWFQSVNPLLIVLLAPLFALLWSWLARLKLEPSTPLKMSIGLLAMGAGFLFMVIGAKYSAGGALVSPFWLIAALAVNSGAELCLSPVGLSFITKLAPLQFASMMMGVWFTANFVANVVAGYLGGQVDGIAAALGGGQSSFFMIFVIVPAAMGLVMLALVPLLKKLMHGRG